MDLGFLTATELGSMNNWQNFVISESSLTEVLFTDKIGLAIFTDLVLKLNSHTSHKLNSAMVARRDQFFSGKLSCEVIEIVDLLFSFYKLIRL